MDFRLLLQVYLASNSFTCLTIINRELTFFIGKSWQNLHFQR